MGLFRRKEKEYTLAEAKRKLKEDEDFKNHIAIPINPEDIFHTKYWLRLDEKELKQVPQVETPFQEKRKKLMDEIRADGAYRNMSYNIQDTHSTKPGRVVYNNYQSAKNYQKKYGQSR